MTADHLNKPKIRIGVDAQSFEDAPEGTVTVYDSGGLSTAGVNVSPAALWLIGQMDGQHTLGQIRENFRAAAGQELEAGVLEKIVQRLDNTLLLEGPSFETHYDSLVAQYRALPARPALGRETEDSTGTLGEQLDAVLAESPNGDDGANIVGLVAPHLDFARGRPCYAAAYARLAGRGTPDRVVILGTNHNPRTFAPTVTGQDYETPLGQTPTDRAFIKRLEARCGDLRRCELEHAREHSVELQLLWCQHLFGPEAFRLVPILCTDPTTPRQMFGAVPERSGVQEVAEALCDLLAEDASDTLVIAGADLSHVGQEFGDEPLLDTPFLEAVEQRDASALERIAANDSDGFLANFANGNNPTKVCSIGCIYMLLKALPEASAEVVGYHQAAQPDMRNCVTCAAAVLRA
jgi:AmmeMemoRadiSam system protein B